MSPVPKPVEVIPVKTEKELLHEQIAAILREYNNMESEIPLNHDYWKMTNTYRSMK